MSKIRLAIIGCGAVTKINHLPAVLSSNHFELVALIDKNLQYALEIKQQYHVKFVVRDYNEVLDEIDAAIVALPNSLHAPITIDLLEKKIHILVEKPMALTTKECDEMITAGEKSNTVLAVALDFRFFYSSQFIKQLLEKGILGDIRSFEVRQGVSLTWPNTSDYLLRREMAGGGVLIDFGPHVLDLVLWWLGDYDSVEYYDDSMGGVEANCELRLGLRCGAFGVVELSRIRNLRNTCIIRGELGTLEVGIWDHNPLMRFWSGNADIALTGHVMQDDKADDDRHHHFLRQLDNFAASIVGHKEPLIPGSEGRRTIELIENCYASRKMLDLPHILVGE